MRTPVASPATRPFSPATPQNYISPSTRRHVGVTNNSNQSPLLMNASENDDEAEKRARRRSKVLVLQRRHLSSPGTPTDRRRSAPLSGLTSTQLSDHYANCIKLSAENKINAKNAFGLHLIDYMSDLLKKKEMTNFQVASSTLDASAKIYAGRVDAIHSETYKVLSGLGRGNEEKGDNDGEGMGDDGDEENKKKKKRTRKSNTIETNIKALNVNKFDLEFEVDPLFHKMSASFDEGGTKGLMMNQLCCYDDASAIVLDSNTTIMDCVSHEATEHSTNPVDLMDFKDMYAGMDLMSKQICPAFAEFEFTNWSQNEPSTFNVQDRLAPTANHAFDLDADVEPIPHSENDCDENIGDDGVGFMAGVDDDDGGSSFNDGLSQGTDAVFASISQTVDSIRSGTIGNLMSVLASEPGEYSYFNTNLLRTWAGPAHWKLQPQSKDSRLAQLRDNNKNKKKKAAFRINFDDEIDFEAYFKVTRAATTLTKTTLEKYSKTQTTLPEDLHYEADNLFKHFTKPSIMVRRLASSSDNVDDGVENYDYNNANDRENFCPGVDVDDDDDNDMTHAGFDLTAGGSDYGSQSQQNLSAGSFGANESVINGTILAGDNLVAQPNKVSKILIDYAKQAKKIDVKKLKHSIWNYLTHDEEDKENQQAENEEPVKHDHVLGAKSFKDLMHTLPEKVSKNMARNLSVPITFVCLLHLANEKTLSIVHDDSLSDLRILQET